MQEAMMAQQQALAEQTMAGMAEKAAPQLVQQLADVPPEQ